jgi:hypothetical protein
VHRVAHRPLPYRGAGDRRARLAQLVKDTGDPRQLLLFQIAVALYDREEEEEEEASLSELLQELDGEDLDRVLQAIAMTKRRQLTSQETPADLWIRAAEPEDEPKE